jgi:hypothetical protein
MTPDKYHGEGGTFEIKDGERVLVTPPTKPHPEGDRARGADGKPVDQAPAVAAGEKSGRSAPFYADDNETSSDN